MTMLFGKISSLIFLLFQCCDLFALSNARLNNRPVIGILSMPEYQDESKSSIPSSYVKFIEAAGGRVLPVLVSQDEQYYAEVVNITNGMLFTGGSLYLNTSIYTKSAKMIWDYALKINAKGDYYPLWGTCQGLELFTYLANNLSWPLTVCSSWDRPLHLNFLLSRDELRKTRIFANADDRVIQILGEENVTINLHHWCLTPESYVKTNLRHFFRAISSNQDVHGLKFISMIEAFNVPIYAVQFHPERVIFEPLTVKSYHNTPHSFDAVLVSQYFANFFVNETRKSGHIYPDSPEYGKKLIYNYCPVFTGLDVKTENEQTYYFG